MLRDFMCGCTKLIMKLMFQLILFDSILVLSILCMNCMWVCDQWYAMYTVSHRWNDCDMSKKQLVDQVTGSMCVIYTMQLHGEWFEVNPGNHSREDSCQQILRESKLILVK